MGWKTNTLVAFAELDRPLAEGRANDASKAAEIAAAIDRGLIPVGDSTYEIGGYSGDDHTFVGAYSDAILIGGYDPVDGCFDGETPPIVATLRGFLPGARVLALGLHSVVDWFAYAWFIDGELQRVSQGCGGDGEMIRDDGAPLPEEEALLARSARNEAGERVWIEEQDGEREEIAQWSMGEEFAFEVARLAFGARLDEFDHDRLPMTEFRPPRKVPWRWFKGP
ncbi:MAG: hypothetical protein AAF805_12215 [Planctomycetota bacterium]